jgi:UDP-glucose 4-epimerase
MRYLVTGGAGFIGSNIVTTLLERGQEVRILDNFTTGRMANISPVLSDIDLIDGDIRDFWTCLDAARDCDYVLHQAALPSVPRSVANPQTTNRINIDGLLNMLEAARRRKVRRFVFASSSSVYGDTPTLPKIETMPPNPMSPYATTKLTGEFYCRNFFELYGLPTVCLRYFNIFGPRQDPNSNYAAVVPKFITSLLTGRRPTVYGDGEQSRDFTYIENAVEANILACESEQAPGGVYNVACGDRFTLNQLINVLQEIIGSSVKPFYTDERAGDIKHSLADIQAAKNGLGYEPRIDFKQGLAKTVAWYRLAENRVEIPV